MWRFPSRRPAGFAEEIDTVMKRLEQDEALVLRADATMAALKDEPVFEAFFRCPQSPNFHAEGPTLEHHVRCMLVSLYAILEGKLHLLDIEEFRRLRGYGGEIEEMEETMKEQAATMEVFCLCHDLGKLRRVTFEARPGSQGDRAGLISNVRALSPDAAQREREALLRRYAEAFAAFAKRLPDASEPDIQAQFFLEYQVTVHYHGHAHAIFEPDLRAAFDLVAEAHRLTVDDANSLLHLINVHMDLVRGFRKPDVAAYRRLVEYAKTSGRDADDFIDVAEAAVLLDTALGSRYRSAHGLWHDPTYVENLLHAERDYAPDKSTARAKKREARLRKAEQASFREVGIDGDSLRGVLSLEPGPAFGKALKAIQSVARDGGSLPVLPLGADEGEVIRRIHAYQLLDREEEI